MVNLKNLKYGFSIKQIYNYYLYKKSNKKDTILNYRPIWLLIYVSDLCNLRCEMCPHHSGKNNDFEYQKQLSKKFISLYMLEKIYKKAVVLSALTRDGSASCEFEIGDINDSTELKYMLWDSIMTLMPLSEAN